MNDEAALVYARQLLKARLTGERLPLLSARYRSLDLAFAERIADLTTAISGDRIVGYKLGYTSQAMRSQMGIESPNWGKLTSAMDVGRTPPPLLVHPLIEPEIAVVVDRELGGGDLTVAQLENAVRSVHIALEVVDTRYTDYSFTLEDNTADGSSAAAFVLGVPHDFKAFEDSDAVILREEGEVIAQGAIEDAMGGPILALRWLTRELFKRSMAIEAGMVILTGGLTSAPPVERGVPYSAHHSGLGRVDFTWPEPPPESELG